MKRTLFLLFCLLLMTALFLSGCDPVVTDINVACDTHDLIVAINTANASPSTITTLHLDPSCVYELTAIFMTDSLIYPSGAGLPEIVSPIIIDGQAATIRRSDAPGTPAFRIFMVGSSGNLTINNIFLRGGSVLEDHSYGGAILNYGVLFISTCDVYENSAYRGGAIYNLGTFETLWSVYYDNQAESTGGAIHSSGEMTLDRSQFGQNLASWGGAVHNHDALATIEGSIFAQNQAGSDGYLTGFGGAISNTSGDATPPVGKMYIYDSKFNSNDAGYGGAIANMNFSEIAIQDSPFYDNYARQGGAIFNQEEMTLIRSVLYDNRAEFWGGAVFYHDTNESFGLAITNSTFSGNSITGSAPSSDAGSAILHYDGGLGMRYVTISQNSGAVAYSKMSGSGTIENSIVAQNPAGDCGGAAIATLDTLGKANIDSDGSCPGFTMTGDPLLDPLADNGGDTMTHALQANSPALGTALGYCPTEDQRGQPRPNGADCDLGAFESQDYTSGMIPEPEVPEAMATIPVPEELQLDHDWWWKFEGYVCSDSRLTEFFMSTSAETELFEMTINEKPVKCYQQSYDTERYWCHVERVMLDWGIQTEVLFCMDEVCSAISRVALSQATCEGDNPPTEPEPQDCSTFATRADCNAAPGCGWVCDDNLTALLCSCRASEE